MKLVFLMFLGIGFLCCPHAIYADEIYQDENGVWRNRPASQPTTIVDGIESATKDSAIGYLITMGKPSTTSSEIYQDKDGVWRNRDIKTNVNPIGDGVHAFTKGLSEGVIEGLNSTVGNSLMELNTFKAPPSTVNPYQELDSQAKHIENMKFYNELNESKQNFEGYEQFDPAKVGEIKSEWEFFEDPR